MAGTSGWAVATTLQVISPRELNIGATDWVWGTAFCARRMFLAATLTFGQSDWFRGFRSARIMINPYVVGDVGYYRRVVEFTQPTLQPAVVFDPFFGFFQGAIPADRVLG